MVSSTDVTILRYSRHAVNAFLPLRQTCNYGYLCRQQRRRRLFMFHIMTHVSKQ